VDLSIVLPICDERDNVEPLFDEIAAVLRPFGRSFEIIAVDDGSRDGTTDVLRRMAAERSYVKLLVFRRNHGQSAAFDAGFRHASGDVVVTMDADRQNDPADIPGLLAMLDEGYDVVTGWRQQRRDGFALRRLPSRIANALIRLITGTRVHDLGCSLRVYRRAITDELRVYGEMHRFIAVLAEDLGARVGERVVNHRPRPTGRSKYGLGRMFRVLLDLCTVWFLKRFQTKPIYIFGGIGALMALAGSGLCAIVLWQKFQLGVWVHRNPLFSIAVMCFLMAMQFIGAGLLAEMIIRTYFESQGKPSYSIAARIGFDRRPPNPPAVPLTTVKPS
jgi:glycosyltransferase involved in cell wall biosynthesis